MSTIVGLLEYKLGLNRNYELDSSKHLVKPIRKEARIENKTIQNPQMNNNNEFNYLVLDISRVLHPHDGGDWYLRATQDKTR